MFSIVLEFVCSVESRAVSWTACLAVFPWSVDNPGSFEGGICARVWMDASLPMKKENLTNILFRQASCSVPATHAAFLLPWESGPLQRILGNVPGLIPQPVFVPQPDASMTVSPEAPRPVQAPLKVPVRKQWKHRFASNSWAKEKDRKRRKLLEMWLQIVQRDPFSTTVGMQIHGMTNSEMLAVLADVFRSKATATLFSRAGSVLAFIRWGIAELGEAFVLFPTDEGIAYEYICHLRDERAPATKAQRFLQALAFSGGLLGVDMKETLGSRRSRLKVAGQ